MFKMQSLAELNISNFNNWKWINNSNTVKHGEKIFFFYMFYLIQFNKIKLAIKMQPKCDQIAKINKTDGYMNDTIKFKVNNHFETNLISIFLKNK